VAWSTRADERAYVAGRGLATRRGAARIRLPPLGQEGPQSKNERALGQRAGPELAAGGDR